MSGQLSLAEVNSLGDEQFSWVFGNVVELCSGAAAQVATKRPFDSIQQLIEAFGLYLDALTAEEKVNVLRLHPDLAGRLAERGQLTAESSREQETAGLHHLAADEKSVISHYNTHCTLSIEQDTICHLKERTDMKPWRPFMFGALGGRPTAPYPNAATGYKEKFGFPFIICARENKVKSIIDGLMKRYNNVRPQEITTGINEVKKICALRVKDLVSEN